MKYILTLVLGLAIMMGSCEKFLEETPTGTLTSDATVTSAPGGDALVLGPYFSLGNWVDGAEQWGMNLAASLEYWTGKGYSEYMGSILWIYESDGLSGDLGYFINQWNNWYRGVRECNLSLSLIPGVTGMSEDQKSQAIGQLRTLRAFYYFCLVRYYGDVPLITTVITDLAQVAQPRASIKTIYDKVIVPDLEFALESKLADAQSTGGRITKLTARTILADVYLTMAGYPYQEINSTNDTTKCVTGAWTMSLYPVNNASAIELLGKAKVQLDFLYGKFSLGTYDDLRDPKMNNKGEKIFQAQFLSGTRNCNIVPFCLPLGSRISAYNDEFGTFIPSPAYNASYALTDKRVQDRQMFFYSDTKAPKHDPNEGPAAKFAVPFLYKYYDYNAVKVTPTSGLNWTFYRYADVLLMLTEVNWTLNSLGTAVAEDDIIKGINAVRARALLPALTGIQVNLPVIMGERAYELIFESKMLWDQRRTRLALIDGVGQWAGIEPLVGHQPATFNYAFTTKHLFAPISSTEIANNRNCLQNYGWNPKQIGQ